jgi:hypothetical protein
MTAGRRIWWTSLGLALTLAGCRHTTNQELLESELRTKEIQYRELLDEHEKAEHHNQAMERELEGLRRGSKLSSEEAAQIYNVKRIALGRLTAGQDTDKRTGDDALNLVVEPRDGADHIIKAPGTLSVQALEISSQGVKRLLNSWEISSHELARSWKSGLFSSGYVLTLPFKYYPTSENLRVVARLVTPDGRIYEADKDIRVQLVPGAEHLRPPPAEKGPTFPAPETPGPMPRPIDPLDLNGRTSPRGPALAPAGMWQATPLDEALRLQRPIPLSSE